MDSRRATDKKVSGGVGKGAGKTKGEAVSLLAQVIDVMIQKKALQVSVGDMQIVLSPMAFQTDDVQLDTPGNNAENIDELLYIKKPKNGFPKF